jgi:hypothetical protein
MNSAVYAIMIELWCIVAEYYDGWIKLSDDISSIFDWKLSKSDNLGRKTTIFPDYG